jgi:hypothetical protein
VSLLQSSDLAVSMGLDLWLLGLLLLLLFFLGSVFDQLLKGGWSQCLGFEVWLLLLGLLLAMLS